MSIRHAQPLVALISLKPDSKGDAYLHIYALNANGRRAAFNVFAADRRLLTKHPHDWKSTMSAGKRDGQAEVEDITAQGMSGRDIDTQSSMGEPKGDVRLDHYGYALIPQPSHFRDDPLVR
jgi:hypothetical protein